GAGIGAVDDKGAAGKVGRASACPAGVHHQRAGVHGGRTGVADVTAQRERASAILVQSQSAATAAVGQRAGEGAVTGAADKQPAFGGAAVDQRARAAQTTDGEVTGGGGDGAGAIHLKRRAAADVQC